MAEKVGEIYFDVTLDTAQLIDGQRKVKRELDTTTKSMDSFGFSLSGVAKAVSILGVAMATLKSAQLADEMRMLAAQVEVAAGNMEAGASAMAALEAIAKRTQTSIGANASVFNRLNQSMLQMGGTQQDTLNLTELLAKAIKVSGASATEGASAMTQFGQALGSGKLGGDELSSLLENAPYLMQKLAQGIGVPVGALKKMGEEGKLTADVVTNALNKAADQIDADFKKFPQTIASAMDVAQDAAGRLNSKMDELTGTSAAITGVVQGAGTVFDELARQIGEAAGESDKLGRNDSIKSWAESTKVVLSYVVDAGDFVVRMFRQMGAALGGLAASAGAAMSGEFSQSRAILGEMLNDIKAVGNAPMMGQKMRDQFAKGPAPQAGPVATGSTLKAPTSAGTTKAGGKKGSTAKEFDVEGYLADLKRSTVDAMEAIDIAEQESIRKNDELLQKKNITLAQHEQARTLILANAQQERAELEAKAEQKRKADFDKAVQEAIRDDAAREQAMKQAGAILIENDPAAKVKAQYQARADALNEAMANELISEQLHSQAIIANQDSMNRALADLAKQKTDQQLAAQAQLLTGTSQLFGNLADLAKQSAGEQSDIFKAMFVAQKAFAIASAIINIQTAMSSAAMSVPFPGNLAAIGTVVGATAGIVSTISGTNYGGARQYGGPVSSGSMYRVNETGAPEMFTAGNGSQYMLPTTSGKVTAADKVGSGAMKLTIINNTSAAIGSVTEREMGNGERAIIISEAVQMVAAQMGDPNSTVSRSMSRNFSTQRSR